MISSRKRKLYAYVRTGAEASLVIRSPLRFGFLILLRRSGEGVVSGVGNIRGRPYGTLQVSLL